MDAVETNLQGSISGLLLRGGTSKGFFVERRKLPADPETRDELLLELFGTPDDLQIDGIGGSHSHTSKVILVSESDRDGIDVEYTFGQVGIENPSIDWGGNCGNLTSAVGMFAIYQGWVPATGSQDVVSLYNTNTETVVEQTVPISDGEPAVGGDFSIDGVPGTGARIDSTFRDPVGSLTDELLPSGNKIDTVRVAEDSIEISIVDVGNLNVFLRATDLGLRGTELPTELSEISGFLDRIETIRAAACEHLGLVETREEALEEHPSIPQIAVVSEAQAYESTTGQRIEASDQDITARQVTTQTPHHSYAMTGAMCLAAASRLDGTIPSEFVRPDLPGDEVRIGHPKGTITIGVTTADGVSDRIESVRVPRTARLIMAGRAFYRPPELRGD